MKVHDFVNNSPYRDSTVQEPVDSNTQSNGGKGIHSATDHINSSSVEQIQKNADAATVCIRELCRW